MSTPVSPHKKAWQLAWPMILANISTPLIGLADTAMLGRLDNPVYVGSVAIGANVLALFFWVFSFLRMGATSLTGQALGARNNIAIDRQLLQGSLFALVLGILLLVFSGLLLPFVLRLMAPQPDLHLLASRYAEIRIFSAPAVFITYVIMGWFVGLQNTLVPLLVTITANLVNLLLDYLLIIHYGWGSEGAALASLIAEYTALGICLAAVFLRYRQVRRKFSFPIRQLHKMPWAQLFTLNAHLFVRTAVLLLVFNFFIAESARQGTLLLAANAILLQLVLFTSFALDGYAHAAESMAAHAVGARNRQLFHANSQATFIAAGIIAIFICAVFIFLGSPILSLMTQQNEVRVLALQYLPWLYVLPLASVWCYVLDGIFIGSGQTRLMRNSMLLAVFGGFFPIWWLTHGIGNTGLWIALTMFNLARGLLLGMVYFYLSRNALWFQAPGAEKANQD